MDTRARTTGSRAGVRHRAGLATLVAAALLALAVPAPQATGAPDHPAAAEQQAELGGTTISGLMGYVEKSVIEEATSSLFGWATSALGLGSDNGQEAAIVDELQNISEELSQIQQAITQLDAAVKQETCDLEAFDTTTDARARIDTVAGTYNSAMANADEGKLQTFLDEVFDEGGDGVASIDEELATIDDALLSAGNADGVLASCIKAIDLGAANTLDDRDYYDLVSNLTGFFYGYQVQGLLLVVEAYHLQAYQLWAKENPTAAAALAPDDVSQVCVDPTGEVASLCGEARTEVEEMYDRLVAQFAYAGAPYSTDDAKLLNQTPYLWALELEAFTAAAGDTCASPLVGGDTCGVTAGGDVSDVLFGGREGWGRGSQAGWAALLAGHTSGTPSTYLNGLGFSQTQNKIIYTGATAQFTEGDLDETVRCFVDTSMDASRGAQPFCSGNQFGQFLTGTWRDPPCEGPGESSWLPTSADPKNLFYDAGWVAIDPGGDCNDGDWQIAPGWSDEAIGNPAYDWPMVDASKVTCTEGRTVTNLGGDGEAYTLCGDDFDTWLEGVLPPLAPLSDTPPTDDPTTTPAAATAVPGQPTYTG